MAFLGSGLNAQDSAELRQLLGGRVRPLAIAESPAGLMVGLVDRLVFRLDDRWLQVGWHEVERGGWNPQTRQLSFATVNGEDYVVELSKPRKLPQLLNERVTASIACSEVVQLSGTHSAVISARRNLGQVDAPLIWRVRPGKSTTPEQIEADPMVNQELARLRRDYEPD